MKVNNIEFLLVEYDKLKDEQHKRIEFRDHMIYLTLAGIGAVFSFALEKPALDIAFLVLPFMCIVLGWTYLGNDEKISSISNYIKNHLISNIQNNDNDSNRNSNWEQFLNADKKRNQRKFIQLIIDISVFCISGLVSVVCFFVLHPTTFWYHILLATIEVIFLLYLSYQFTLYADLKRKK